MGKYTDRFIKKNPRKCLVEWDENQKNYHPTRKGLDDNYMIPYSVGRIFSTGFGSLIFGRIFSNVTVRLIS